MAYFAEIAEDNYVIRVLVVPDEQEHRGQEYLAEEIGLGGRWIQTSYTNRIRGRFAGKGDYYDESLDKFLPFKDYNPEIHIFTGLQTPIVEGSN